jgi:hypothetical protein
VWEGTARLPPPEEIEEPDTRPEVWLGEGTPHWLHFETLSHLTIQSYSDVILHGSTTHPWSAADASYSLLRLSTSDNRRWASFPLTICRKIELLKYFSVVHFLNVGIINILGCKGDLLALFRRP